MKCRFCIESYIKKTYLDGRSRPLKLALAVLICLLNVILTAKSEIHTLQFAIHMVAALYYIAVGLERNVTQRTDNRE